MDIRKRIGRKVRKIVAEKCLNVERLALDNKISVGYLYDIMNGKANLTVTMLERLAKGLRVRPRDLLD